MVILDGACSWTIRKSLISFFQNCVGRVFWILLRKIVTETKLLVVFCMFSHGKSISARKPALHHKVSNNDRYSFYGEAELTVFVGHRYVSGVTNYP